jgi:hypothetical protein
MPTGLASGGVGLTDLGSSRLSRLEVAKPAKLTIRVGKADSGWLAISSTRFVCYFIAPFDLKHVHDIYNLFTVPQTIQGYF